MILRACCSCGRAVRIVAIAALVEVVTFPAVHWLWENAPILSRVSETLGA